MNEDQNCMKKWLKAVFLSCILVSMQSFSGQAAESNVFYVVEDLPELDSSAILIRTKTVGLGVSPSFDWFPNQLEGMQLAVAIPKSHANAIELNKFVVLNGKSLELKKRIWDHVVSVCGFAYTPQLLKLQAEQQVAISKLAPSSSILCPECVCVCPGGTMVLDYEDTEYVRELIRAELPSEQYLVRISPTSGYRSTGWLGRIDWFGLDLSKPLIP